MRRPFEAVAATAEEVAAQRSGDDIVARPDAVMDRAFTVEASPEQVWPWLLQLGKQRAGWYLPRTAEWFVPARHRAIRTLDQQWLQLEVGDIIPDYGGRHETFTVAAIDSPKALVYTSKRRRMLISWSITLTPLAPGAAEQRTRVHLRLRLGPVRRTWLVNSVGELLDLVTIAGMAAGLRERVADRN